MFNRIKNYDKILVIHSKLIGIIFLRLIQKIHIFFKGVGINGISCFRFKNAAK